MTRVSALAAALVAVALSCAGCAALPDPPGAVGDDYPGTCMPAELSWPTDFLESLPGESSGVGGRIVGLRLEYIDSEFIWRLRSADTKYDAFGEQVIDPGFGRESLLNVRTLEPIATREVELTEAEQRAPAAGALDAAIRSGEQWPSPLIIEMMLTSNGDTSAWQVTTCNTDTNEQSVTIVD